MQALNEISQGDLELLLDMNLSALEVRRSGAGTPDAEALGKLTLDVGLCRHGLSGDPAQVKRDFQEAAGYLAQGLAARPVAHPDAYHNPYQALYFAAVIASFGRSEDVALLRTLDPTQICQPVEPDQKPVADALALLFPFLDGAPIDRDAAGRLLQTTQEVRANKVVRTMLAPLLSGAVAIADRDQDAWNLAIAEVTATHVASAMTGDFQFVVRGLVCFEGLMLVRLGRAHGMTLQGGSEYLPVALLETGREG